MQVCGRDTPLTEAEISGMEPEAKLSFLQGFVDELFFNEKNVHDVTRSEWETIIYIMRDAPGIFTCDGGKAVVNSACSLMYSHHLGHKPRTVEDDSRIKQLKKWADIYDLSLQGEKQEKRAA